MILQKVSPDKESFFNYQSESIMAKLDQSEDCTQTITHPALALDQIDYISGPKL